MALDERFQRVSVIGAAGKMGSGIALVLAREMAFRSLADPGRTYSLNLVDVDPTALEGLLRHLGDQAAKEAERQQPRLQGLGVEPSRFIGELRALLRTGTSLELAQDSQLVFEAASESEELKISIYRELAALCPRETWFFSNTSSIPLRVLGEASGLQGRLVGFHFYNPPLVQKLLELITPQDCGEELQGAALELAGVLGKTVVPAADVAGFIGNGFLMRDGLHALAEVERLSAECGFPQALCMVDRVSRDWLLRPMGIFQLMDYVGLDVFQLILAVMDRHLAEPLHSILLDRLVTLGRRGGETFAGVQKDGFFRYEQNHPIGLCDPETGTYLSFEQPWALEIPARLGEHPDASLTWKTLKGAPDKATRLRAYFARFRDWPTPGVQLAKRHLQAERRTAQKLVDQGVAASAEDVNRVLQLGFYHLYGPLNDYV